MFPVTSKLQNVRTTIFTVMSQVLRFCFAKKQETLDKAVERLIKV